MIFITGATGFVGSHVLKELLGLRETGNICMLTHRQTPASSLSGIKTVQADITGLSGLSEVLSGTRCIIHLAAVHSESNPDELIRVNVKGMESVIALAHSLQVEKIIYLSSTGVYGHGNHYLATEETPKRPDTGFSQSKYKAESLLRESGIPAIILRHRFVTGQGDKYVIPGFMQAFQKMPFMVNGGRARLSFIDAGDLAGIIARFATATTPVNGCREFHVTSGETVTVAQVLTVLGNRLFFRKPARFPLPLQPLYTLLKLKQWISRSKGEKGLTPLRLKFLGTDNHFSNEKLVKEFPGLTFKSFEESIAGAADYYRRFTGQ
jgi:2-alkyl-3-oxoalkanoate reductase